MFLRKNRSLVLAGVLVGAYIPATVSQSGQLLSQPLKIESDFHSLKPLSQKNDSRPGVSIPILGGDSDRHPQDDALKSSLAGTLLTLPECSPPVEIDPATEVRSEREELGYSELARSGIQIFLAVEKDGVYLLVVSPETGEVRKIKTGNHLMALIYDWIQQFRSQLPAGKTVVLQLTVTGRAIGDWLVPCMVGVQWKPESEEDFEPGDFVINWFDPKGLTYRVRSHMLGRGRAATVSGGPSPVDQQRFQQIKSAHGAELHLCHLTFEKLGHKSCAEVAAEAQVLFSRNSAEIERHLTLLQRIILKVLMGAIKLNEALPFSGRKLNEAYLGTSEADQSYIHWLANLVAALMWTDASSVEVVRYDYLQTFLDESLEEMYIEHLLVILRYGLDEMKKLKAATESLRRLRIGFTQEDLQSAIGSMEALVAHGARANPDEVRGLIRSWSDTWHRQFNLFKEGQVLPVLETPDSIWTIMHRPLDQ